MSLPSNLITEFVRITNDTEKPNKETTVYGTIVKDGSITYARLDGSDVLTPVSATADTQHGERVTVLIKNHTATVTGNISSPAARTGDVQQLEETVETINVDYATVNNKLNATNAELDNLEVTHGNFETLTTQKFDALDARIDDLNVKIEGLSGGSDNVVEF